VERVRSILSLSSHSGISREGSKQHAQVKYGQLDTSSSKSDGDDDTVYDDKSNMSQRSYSFTIEDDSDSDHDDNNNKSNNKRGNINHGGLEMMKLNGFKSDSLSFDQQESVIVLKNISLSLPSKSLIAICGSTGSGKSTLVAGMLGECRTEGGSVSIEGKISYVSQTAWIQNASLRANILFGLEYEEEKYLAIIVACGLEFDLKQLADGDMTDIGEKGMCCVVMCRVCVYARLDLNRWNPAPPIYLIVLYIVCPVLKIFSHHSCVLHSVSQFLPLIFFPSNRLSCDRCEFIRWTTTACKPCQSRLQ
jgi:ABC-type multidrug transport system fused ATPase/permease subunit